MNIRKLDNFDDHEMVIALTDEESKLAGYIAIHNTNLGPALGGTRLLTYKNHKDAIDDVLNLSRSMTYKCALAGLPYGGGKGVIIQDYSSSKNDVLKSYSLLVNNLNGLFKTGTDVGLSELDVKEMHKTSKHMLGVVEADRGTLSTSKSAAIGVYQAVIATLEFLYDSNSPKDKKFAVNGIGKLGWELAKRLYEAGGIVSIADINNENVKKFKLRYPNSEVVAISEIHKLNVDVYSPCALGNAVNNANINEFNCKAIVGGANNQLQNTMIAKKLHKKNILYGPDYIANAGGLIYVANELRENGFNIKSVINDIDKIYETMSLVLQESKKKNRTTLEVANEIAIRRIENKQ